MGKLIYFILFLTLTGWISSSTAQEVSVEGYFLKDSAKLGERVGYVLKATYPPSMNILFPDSAFNFGSMDYLSKQTFTSYTKDSLTLDSAVYYLSNFSLEPVKSYRLPVFEVLRYDSISHLPLEANLQLVLTIGELPDVLTFQESNAYQKIKQGFNYPMLILVLGLITVLAIASYFLFGQQIRDSWFVYLEKKKRKKFLIQWQLAKQRLVQQPDLSSADELLGLWKSYMESLTGQPYREWTTTEIADHLAQPNLVKDIRDIEVIIYADRVSENLDHACKNLTAISENSFEEKIKSYHAHE
ncbi:hypothetical protein [Lunatibacter salilacus]|uniref:hypothetical protein n=1 Tax=Lunatibacter salilacus TaxID=2483804 RepID=UPI001F3B65A3|nr:hypothetical protein [Lunatibacter salilacus]